LDKLQEVKPQISKLLDEKAGTGNVLVTVHRRESWGEGLGNVFQSLSQLAKRYPDLSFWIPLHPNPKVRESVPKDFFESSQMHLLDPLEYQDSVYAIAHCDLVITDSGGIQEERVAIGKHVIVARSETDRPEGVSAGLAHLCGTDPKKLLDTSIEILSSLQKDSSPTFQNIYGDGNTSNKIVSDLIANYY
jgi:UDP-N-acetylglucosamine 2-epimerase (non-hydrolysing)